MNNLDDFEAVFVKGETSPGVKVLLIGWYKEALESLVKLGCDVVNVINAKHIERSRQHNQNATILSCADVHSAEEVIESLTRASIHLEQFSVICSMRELALVTASILKELTQCQGMSTDVAVALRDKYVQKRLVKSAGIPVTDFYTVDLITDIKKINKPVIIKPLSGGGARDTFRVDSINKLGELRNLKHIGPWLVEDLVSGSELHLDGVIRDGEVKMLSISRYLTNVIEIQNGGLVGSIVHPPKQNHLLYERGRALVTDALTALGHTNGIFHLEAFDTPSGLVFSECGGRIGGGMIFEEVNHLFGVNLAFEWAKSCLGYNTRVNLKETVGTVGFVHLPSPEGRIIYVPSEEEVMSMEGCVKASVNIKVGQIMKNSAEASNIKAGKALVQGKDEEEVEIRLRKLASWFQDQVQTASPNSERS
ncbi:acetyl-CoA carboxylase biotin carboxylase subunit family protein [Bacillus cereus group sp. BfR-BA-01309]|uniref:ATP-grasp domain-containing protein n=1 Tax=Bacillus cereus group sp. BfR-BA-01309 TaxID=2920286 RepID=UPI001F56F394|nr:hypothetical protein [Bacillus cereus group sp. BfR-BA-01309]